MTDTQIVSNQAPQLFTDEQLKEYLSYFKENWIETATGNKLYIVSTERNHYDIEDIAIGLSQQPRFAGQQRFQWPVAGHLILAYQAAKRNPDYCEDRDFLLHAIMHDAIEAYLHDLSLPLKQILAPIYKPIEKLHEKRLYSQFGINPTPDQRNAVKHLDTQLLLAEANVVMWSKGKEWELRKSFNRYDIASLSFVMMPRSADEFKYYWLKCFNEI
jgi:hypothetical protein